MLQGFKRIEVRNHFTRIDTVGLTNAQSGFGVQEIVRTQDGQSLLVELEIHPRESHIVDPQAQCLHQQRVVYHGIIVRSHIAQQVELGVLVTFKRAKMVDKSSDYIIDIGPEGGDQGGRIVAAGTPEEIVKNKESLTGKWLKDCLKKA